MWRKQNAEVWLCRVISAAIIQDIKVSYHDIVAVATTCFNVPQHVQQWHKHSRVIAWGPSQRPMSIYLKHNTLQNMQKKKKKTFPL